MANARTYLLVELTEDGVVAEEIRVGTRAASAALDVAAAASRAVEQGAHLAASAGFEQAARLSPVSAPAYLTRAAGAAFDADALERASVLVAEAEAVAGAGALDVVRGEGAAVRGLCALRAGRPRTALSWFVRSVESGFDAADNAARAAITVGDPELLAETAAVLDSPFAVALRGLTELYTGEIERGVARIRSALEHETVRIPELAQAVGDDATALRWARTDVERCRTHGLAGRLPLALRTLARVQTYAGLPVEPCDDATRSWAHAVTDLLEGRPEHALGRLRDLLRNAPALEMHAIADVVDAAVRAGRPDVGHHALARFRRWVLCTGSLWGRAVLHRLAALLAEDDALIDREFRTALDHHTAASPADRAYERARTCLLYGEWLRRIRLRSEARIHLAEAYEIFGRLHANAWAERANAELRATGVRLRRRDPESSLRLTPQERQVVRLAAEGGSNKDIAAQLFLSPRTVGYHLSNAFSKLGVASRRELPLLDIDASAS